MFTKPLSGIVPPLVTPLLAHETLDHEGVERLLTRMIDAGCAGVFVLGTTGEAQALSYSLRLELVQHACRVVRGRIPVLVGITDCSVQESISFGKASAEAGADALVTATPFYFRMGQSDLLRHIEFLAAESPLPLFIYNMPGLTKLAYDPETIARASEIPGIVGFKDSSGDLIYLQRVLRLLRGKPDFTVLIGPEELLGPAVMFGAHGGISGGANLLPELYVALFQAAKDRRLDDLKRLEREVFELSETIYRVGEPTTSYIRGLKTALSVLGICQDLPALPLIPLTEKEREPIASWIGSTLTASR